MGIKLDLSVETPLSDDDRDILAGVAVMVLAIANRQNLAEQGMEEEEELGELGPCGMKSKDDPTLYRDSPVGHSGRHRYRPLDLPVPEERMN